jgi:hypothetical protein
MTSRRTFLIAGAGALTVTGCGNGGRDEVATSATALNPLPAAPAPVTPPPVAPAPGVPPAPAAGASDWPARSSEAGVVVACDFSAPPANGGTYKWGSLKASPHVTCYQQNDAVYGAYVVVDTAVYPPGGSASLRFDVPDCPTSGAAERGDLWWISIDDYADQFGDNAEFWVQWRCRMDSTYATFPFADSSQDATLGPYTSWTAPKQLMLGEGMQPGELGMNPAWPYGFRGAGTSITQNQISGIRVDFEGETNIIASSGIDSRTTASSVFKYPSAYTGKPGYAGLTTNGTDNGYFTNHNSGNEANHNAACQYQLDGRGIIDRSTCFIYPTDEWFTMMVHVKLGARGHGLSSIPFGYRNVPFTRISPTQIRTSSDTVEHFGVVSGGKYLRIRGAATGSVEALVTNKDTSVPGQTTLTLSGLTGTIAAEPLLVDEFENGFVNSTVEYWGAYLNGQMQLLHRRTGLVLRNGNYPYVDTGYSPTAKYGTFAWTTFMTSKSKTQRHPVAKIWLSQIIVKAGATAPSTPA